MRMERRPRVREAPFLLYDARFWECERRRFCGDGHLVRGDVALSAVMGDFAAVMHAGCAVMGDFAAVTGNSARVSRVLDGVTSVLGGVTGELAVVMR